MKQRKLKWRVKKNTEREKRMTNLATAVAVIASHTGIFMGARFSSSLPRNACSTENNIPFPLLYLRGK